MVEFGTYFRFLSRKRGVELDNSYLVQFRPCTDESRLDEESLDFDWELDDESIAPKRSEDDWYEGEAEMRLSMSGRISLCTWMTWLTDCETGADSEILIF